MARITQIPGNQQGVNWNDLVLMLLDLIALNTSGSGPSEDVNVAQWGGVSTTLGQKVSASSVPTVLSSEQELILSNIDAGTSNLDVPLSTRASQATLLLALAELVAINGDIDVALSTRASEATLLTRATEATSLLILAQLTAINADLDVSLSTRNAEVTQLLVLAELVAINAKLVTANTFLSSIDAKLTSPLAVTAPILTKGTQGANGFSVQNLHDAGRNVTNYFMTLPIITTATDTLQSLTGYKSGAAVGATTTPAVVTALKKYRITSIHVSFTAVAAQGSVLFRLRANTGGVVAIGSPLVFPINLGVPDSGTGSAGTISVPIPEGLEFAAGTGIGVSMVGLNDTIGLAANGYGQITITGYEY